MAARRAASHNSFIFNELARLAGEAHHKPRQPYHFTHQSSLSFRKSTMPFFPSQRTFLFWGRFQSRRCFHHWRVLTEPFDLLEEATAGFFVRYFFLIRKRLRWFSPRDARLFRWNGEGDFHGGSMIDFAGLSRQKMTWNKSTFRDAKFLANLIEDFIMMSAAST